MSKLKAWRKDIVKKIKFYDTSSLLKIKKIQEEKPFLISSITLQELETIKNSSHKDEGISFRSNKGLFAMIVSIVSGVVSALYDKYIIRQHIGHP